ncbi:hypothetical protein L6452_33753 [Arctium lappa]|uniref:Uncharacterized protein n=1 Tax=Arctium lappa TaxID=4217 RepID=A0ACB8YGW4_ARCLA|nr:hypothetical protein L6452_33753 [Arctium lappa]
MSFATYTDPVSPAPKQWRKRMSAREMLPLDLDLERRTASRISGSRMGFGSGGGGEWEVVASGGGSGGGPGGFKSGAVTTIEGEDHMEEKIGMMKKYDGGSRKLERKTIEKNRRNHMKDLCYKLTSLVPSLFSQPYKCFTQDTVFDQSIAYIKQLQKRVEQLKEKRDETSRMIDNGGRNNPSHHDQPHVSYDRVRRRPVVEIKELDGGLQVFLTSNLERNFTFSEVIRIVEDGGAEVVKGGYTTVGEKVIYTLHAQARVSRIGVEIMSVYERLQELINQST